MPTKKASCIIIISILLSGCMPGTFEYYTGKKCAVFGHKSKPYFLSKDDVENIYDGGRVDLVHEKTYREAFEKIAEITLISIIITGDDSFLDESIELKDRKERSISLMIKDLLEPVGKTARIKEGWVKVK